MRTEQVVAQTLLQYQAILENASVAIVFTRDRRIVHCNSRASEVFGWTHGELFGRPGSVFYPDEQAYRAMGRLAAPVLARGEALDCEVTMARKDGSTFLCRLRAKAIDPKDTGAGTIWIGDDVTERRREEQQVRDLLLEQQGILDNALVGIAFLREREIVRCNRRMEEIFGYAPGDLTGRSTRVLYPDEEAWELGGRPYPVLRQGLSHEREQELMRRDGERFWCRVSGRALAAEEPARGSVWLFEDITARRDAEQRTVALLGEQQLIFENATVGISFQRSRVIQRCNRRMEELFGYGPGELAGRSTRILFDSAEAWAAAGRRVYRAMPAGRIYEGELCYRRRDGSPFWCRITGKPIDEPGESWIWIYEDVTARREAEDALRRAKQELEQRVTERTAELGAAYESLQEQYYFLRQLLDTLPNPVFYKDEQGRYLGCNRAFEDYLGIGRGSLVGRTDHDVAPRQLADIYRSWDAKLFAKPGTQSYEASVRYADGSWREVLFCKATFCHTDGQVGGLVGVMLDISERKRAQEILDYQAHHDPLTDLPNRLLLEDRLRHALQRARREGLILAVLFVDLDRFKIINDTLGHPVGDRVLQEVAKRLSASLRQSDTVARLGGDEFIVVLERLRSEAEVGVVAEKLVEDLRRPVAVDGQEFFVSASVGISMHPRDGDDVPTLVKNADAAMYRAKERGRNSYEFYNAVLTSAAIERFQLEMRLRHAVEREELRLHFQPQFRLDGTGPLSAEALVRWQHPEWGLIAPDRFIPLAEESGLIVGIGAWVLRNACLQLRAWRDAGLPVERVAVNLSGVELIRGDVLASVSGALSEAGLPAECLELEITESLIMQQAEAGLHVLEGLRGLGVRLAIDDFGTGYSSLSYLKRLPLTKLKIDRSFVRGLPGDDDDAAIARAIIALARSMQFSVTAEGVETEGQREFVRAAGCDEAQGYLLGRPMEAGPFEAILRERSPIGQESAAAAVI